MRAVLFELESVLPEATTLLVGEGMTDQVEILRVLGAGAPVLIVETMIPAGNTPHYSKQSKSSWPGARR